MKNGYTSATGAQDLVSTPHAAAKREAGGASATDTELTIEGTLAGVGVKWLRTVHTYRVGEMKAALNEAMSTSFDGLKVIIAEGECQLERQRRVKPIRARGARGGRARRAHALRRRRRDLHRRSFLHSSLRLSDADGEDHRPIR